MCEKLPRCKDLEQGRPHSQPTNQPTSPPNQPNQQTAQPTSMQSMSSVGMLVPQTSPSASMLCRQRSAPTRSDDSPIASGNRKRLQARDADVPFPPGRNSRDPIVVRSVAPHVFLLLLQCLVQTFLFHLVYRFRLFDPGSSHAYSGI